MLIKAIMFILLAHASAGPCSGHSAHLNSTDCMVWQDLYESTNGQAWTHCSGAKEDPCACRLDASGPGQGVTCSTDSSGRQYITGLEFQGTKIGMTGPLPSSIGSLSQLAAMNFLACGQLTGTVPKTIMNLRELRGFQLAYNSLTGLLPALPFTQYASGSGGWCDIVGNKFACPLPPGALSCHDNEGKGVTCE
jgi:hypothetical protein